MDTNTNNDPTGASNSAENAVAVTASIWNADDLAKHTASAYSFINSVTSYMESTGEGCEVLATGAEGSQDQAVKSYGPQLARLIGRCLKSGKATQDDVVSWKDINVVILDLLKSGDPILPARRRDWRDPSQYGVGVRSLQAELSRLEKLQAVSEVYMVKCDEVLRLQ